MIPVDHAHAAHPPGAGSRLDDLEQAGHYPHLSEPRRFAEVLFSFIAETEPARLDPERLRKLLVRGSAPGQPGRVGDGSKAARLAGCELFAYGRQ